MTRTLRHTILIVAALAVLGLALRAGAQETRRAYLPMLAAPPPTPTATATPVPTATLAPPPEPFFGDCFVDPDPGRAPNHPVSITAIFKGSDAAHLRNRTSEPIALTGWTLCSVTNNGGWDLTGATIGAGETLIISRPQDPIWRTAPGSPQGALYDGSGKLIAYYQGP